MSKSTRWIFMNNLTRYGVKILTGSNVVSIKEDQVKELDIHYSVIGDLKPGKINDAVHGGGGGRKKNNLDTS